MAPILVITGWALALALQASGDFTGAEQAIGEIEELQATISMSVWGLACASS